MKDIHQPLYQHIYDDIVGKIKSGEFVPGDKLPTEFEMVDSYNVSRITVTRALQELVKSGYVERFRSKGSFVADRSASVESSGVTTGNSNTIAVVMPFSSDIVPPLLFSIQQAVQKNNFMLSIFNTEKDINKEREILKQLLNANFAGIVFYPIESYENIPYFSSLLLKGTPFVSIDKTLPYSDVPCIKSDNFTCAYKMVDYLIKKGHKKIAYYCHTLKDENENLRFLGYLKALISNGITPDKNYFMEIEKFADPKIMLAENSAALHNKINSQLYQLMQQNEPPTAMFCAFDLIAAYVEQQAHLLGISIPNDLSVVGFDNSQICDHLQVPLTSVSQDFASIGNTAIDIIMQMINGDSVEPSYMFDGNIFERSSVKDLN